MKKRADVGKRKTKQLDEDSVHHFLLSGLLVLIIVIGLLTFASYFSSGSFSSDQDELPSSGHAAAQGKISINIITPPEDSALKNDEGP